MTSKFRKRNRASAPHRGLPMLIVAGVAIGLLAREATKPPPLDGHWYMGTGTGFDCDLIVHSDHSLTVQYGGCFHRDPAISSHWTLQNGKVVLSSAALRQTLGPYLSIAHSGHNLRLVPQSELEYVATHGYEGDHCFNKRSEGDSSE